MKFNCDETNETFLPRLMQMRAITNYRTKKGRHECVNFRTIFLKYIILNVIYHRNSSVWNCSCDKMFTTRLFLVIQLLAGLATQISGQYSFAVQS